MYTVYSYFCSLSNVVIEKYRIKDIESRDYWNPWNILLYDYKQEIPNNIVIHI